MTKGSTGGTWKLIAVEVGVALLVVFAKEIAERATDYLAQKNKKAKQESEEKTESREPPGDSKSDSENGTS
jgi:hypothetical protein